MSFFQGSSRNTLTGSLIIAFSSLIESQHDLLIKSFDENCFMTTYLGKSCSFCLPRVPFVNCRQFMYLVISLLVLRAGYGIWLYQFLIIAYLFTSTSLLQITFSSFASIWKLHCTCSCSQEGCRNLIRRTPLALSTSLHICHDIITSILCSKTFKRKNINGNFLLWNSCK